ncbi:hypothetical protein AnigIFM50267_001556 [Aspergillus niger]|nr:hypothetical protein AnigIFM50267_001556 [Aspergillus niger]
MANRVEIKRVSKHQEKDCPVMSETSSFVDSTSGLDDADNDFRQILQRLLLKPRLVLQIQETVSVSRHAIPVLELWRPDIFAHRFIIAAHRSVHIRTDDILVSRISPYVLGDRGWSEGGLKNDEDDDNDEVIALIRRAVKTKGDAVIYYKGGYLGQCSRSDMDDFHCEWQNFDGSRETMVLERLESEGEATLILNSGEQQVLALEIDLHKIIMPKQKQQSLSTPHMWPRDQLNRFLVFAAWAIVTVTNLD